MGLFRPNVRKIAATGDVNALIQLLGDHRIKVREEARESLKTLVEVDPQSLQTVAWYFRKPPGEIGDYISPKGASQKARQVRKEIAALLRSLPRPPLRELVAVFEKANDPEVVEDAIMVFESIGDLRALSPDDLPDSTHTVEAMAGWLERSVAARSNHDEPSIADTVDFLTKMPGLATKEEKRAMAHMYVQKELQEGRFQEERVQIAAISALARFKTPGCIRSIEYTSKNSREEIVRSAAAEALRAVERRADLEYVQTTRPPGDGLCSDDNCPCLEVSIARGSGYLYISQSFIDFHGNASLKRDLVAGGAQSMGMAPILVCEQGARLRGLDLGVASADAKHWWETGLVPLRATPVVKA